MSTRIPNILITFIVIAYLNFLAITTISYNPERFIQENCKIYSDELFSNDDKIFNSFYFDADIPETVVSECISVSGYDEHRLIPSECHKSVFLLIDLPPPVFHG
jgi:hypothetical protein